MGIFLGQTPNTDAVKAALKLNWAVKDIIQPTIDAQYEKSEFKLKHTVGIDTSDMLVIRGGIRASNDLAWIGEAANIAAKLNGLSSDYPTRITYRVFNKLADEGKYGGKDKRLMWEKRSWTAKEEMTIYRSSWYWRFT